MSDLTTTLNPGDTLSVRARVVSANGKVRVWGMGTFSVPYLIPVASGGLPDVFYDIDTGDQTVDAAADFTNTASCTWSVDPDTFSVDASGTVTIPTDEELDGVFISVTCTNPDGAYDTTAFQATVQAGGEAAVLSENVFTENPDIVSTRTSHLGTCYWAHYDKAYVAPTDHAAIAAGTIDGFLEGGSFSVTATGDYEEEYTASSGSNGDVVGLAYFLDPTDGAIENSNIVLVDNVLEFPVPDAFGVGDWGLNNPATDGDLTVTIGTLPAGTTDIRYRVDGGTPVSTGGTTGFTITGLTNNTQYDVELWAYGANSSTGVWSDVKSETPTSASGTVSALHRFYNESNLTSYTFTTDADGASITEGNIVVVYHHASTAADPSSVTLNSNSYTKLTSGNQGQSGVSFWYSTAADGVSTGDLVVAFSGSQARCQARVYHTTGFDITTLSDSGFDTDLDNADGSVSVDVPANGMALAAAIRVTTIGGLGNVVNDGGITGAWGIYTSAQTGLAITSTTNGENNGALAAIALAPAP